jgi:hypothetical protein
VSGDVDVRPESLRRAAQELLGMAEDTDGTLQRFQGEIEALGQPWGNDDLGSMIGAVYQGALAMVMNCFVSNLDTVDGYSQRLDVAAGDYEATDVESATRLDGVAASVPELPL